MKILRIKFVSLLYILIIRHLNDIKEAKNGSHISMQHLVINILSQQIAHFLLKKIVCIK